MSPLPTQAVILAGGRGERMRPLSDTRPKPMIEIAGKPILEYLLLELQGKGLFRVLILLGYKGEVIKDYFGNGQSLGLQIDYAYAPESYDTGARLCAAKDQIDPFFLLLYADNLWPIPLQQMADFYAQTQKPALLTVYKNEDHYSRSNCELKDDLVSVYDKTRKVEGLTHVDIGFMLLQKSLLDELPEGNINFEAAIYPKLAQEKRLAAFETRHRYYSLTSPDRIPRVESFLRQQPTVFIDRDGVLNEKAPKAAYIKNWDSFHWIDGAREALALLRGHGYRVLIISNQAGIARGVMSEADLDNIHTHMCADIEAAGGYVAAIYYCPHGWDAGCDCRKPNPGLFFQAQKDFSLCLAQVPFFGDDDRDGLAAQAAGCPFVKIGEGKDLLAAVRERVLNLNP